MGLCYVGPFNHNYFPVGTSTPLALIYGALIIASVIVILRNKQFTHRPALILSLIIFNGALALAIAVSLLLRPILQPRYVAVFVTLLAVPPALLFAELRNRALKGVLFASVFGLGLYASFDAGKESVGAYRTALGFSKRHYPDVRKMLHIIELTGSAFAEYNELGLFEQYWLENANTTQYTNMKAIRNLKTVRTLSEVVSKDERFVLADIPAVPLNRKNLEDILSQCEKISVDTLSDEKIELPQFRLPIQLYQLKYKGR